MLTPLSVSIGLDEGWHFCAVSRTGSLISTQTPHWLFEEETRQNTNESTPESVSRKSQAHTTSSPASDSGPMYTQAPLGQRQPFLCFVRYNALEQFSRRQKQPNFVQPQFYSRSRTNSPPNNCCQSYTMTRRVLNLLDQGQAHFSLASSTHLRQRVYYLGVF